MRIMLIDNESRAFEYDVNAYNDALDQYIETVLGFSKNFILSKDSWETIKNTVDATDDRLILLNELCKLNKYKINKIISQWKEHDE